MEMPRQPRILSFCMLDLADCGSSGLPEVSGLPFDSLPVDSLKIGSCRPPKFSLIRAAAVFNKQVHYLPRHSAGEYSFAIQYFGLSIIVFAAVRVAW